MLVRVGLIVLSACLGSLYVGDWWWVNGWWRWGWLQAAGQCAMIVWLRRDNGEDCAPATMATSGQYQDMFTNGDISQTTNQGDRHGSARYFRTGAAFPTVDPAMWIRPASVPFLTIISVWFSVSMNCCGKSLQQLRTISREHVFFG